MNFKRLAFSTLAIALVCPAAAPANQTSTPNAAVLAPVAASFRAANTGDAKLLHAQFMPSSTIVDEFAPFVWSGSNAEDVWFADFAKVAKAMQMTNTKLELGAAKFTYVAKDRAYIVVPLTVTATIKGKPYKESGLVAFTLESTRMGWKIATQSWAKNMESSNPY